MERKFELRKLEDYGIHIQNYSNRIYEAYDLICEKAGSLMQEEVRDLAEMTYTEGFMDGMKFCIWLSDRR